MGKACAVSDNRDLAESTGIDVERVISMVWIFGSALQGSAESCLVLPNQSTGNGLRILLLMFAGVTLGGLGTASLASIREHHCWPVHPVVNTCHSNMKNVGALLMLIVILLIRPQGLFGRRERIG